MYTFLPFLTKLSKRIAILSFSTSSPVHCEVVHKLVFLSFHSQVFKNPHECQNPCSQLNENVLSSFHLISQKRTGEKKGEGGRQGEKRYEEREKKGKERRGKFISYSYKF
jgi:hypothetical protein